MNQKRERLPSLDGLRAISIILVLCGHLNGTRGFPRFDFGIGDYAHLGVTVFFVISGFLITRLMMAEHAKTGRVSIGRFYVRRSLRLFPAAYVFIGCMGLLTLANLLDLKAADFWHASTYTVNYFPARSWQTGHLWSLSIEEQFYFLWPLAFVLFEIQIRKGLAVSVIVIAPFVRAAVRVLLKGSSLAEMELFPCVADSLAIGCLLAMCREWLERQRWYLRLFQPFWSLSILGLILVLNRYSGYGIVSAFGTSFINIGLAVLIHRVVTIHHDALGRVLNLRPVAFLGVLSYSLYLWQQPFLNRASTAWINKFPQNLTGAVGFALCSYFLLEKPALNLRSRLQGNERREQSKQKLDGSPQSRKLARIRTEFFGLEQKEVRQVELTAETSQAIKP